MKQQLEFFINSWKNTPFPTIIPRDYDLIQYHNLPVCKAICITGFRRVGKTYLLFDLAQKLGKDKCVYLNFENEQFPPKIELLSTLSDLLTELYHHQPITLLLDEIQNIPNWSLWVRRMLDTTNHQIFLSGSSSKLSYNEIPTEMRGRSIGIKVTPLNFHEFLRFKSANSESLSVPQILNLTREFINFGGFPEIVITEPAKKPILLNEYFRTFILRDMIERYHIRNDESLRQLIKLLAHSPYFTISKLTKTLNSIHVPISKVTISRFISQLENSFFLNSLSLHTPGIKNRLRSERKSYFVDSFLLSQLSSEFTLNQGRLLEQVVAQKLFTTHNLGINEDLFYWKNPQGHEVDFVIRDREQVVELIQTSYLSQNDPIPERELKNLDKASKIFSCNNTKLITWDLESNRCIPLYKWLLQP